MRFEHLMKNDLNLTDWATIPIFCVIGQIVEPFFRMHRIQANRNFGKLFGKGSIDKATFKDF